MTVQTMFNSAYGTFRDWLIEIRVRWIMLQHDCCMMADVLESDRLKDEIDASAATQEDKVAWCERELGNACWSYNVLLAGFGRDIFADALRRKLSKSTSA